MLLHEVLAQFSDIVESYEVVRYDVEGLHSRLQLKVSLRNDSQLHVREIVLAGQFRKYAYHWQNASGQLLRRWDNAAHWPQVATHPHHQHLGNDNTVIASNATTLEEVLAIILLQLKSAL